MAEKNFEGMCTFSPSNFNKITNLLSTPLIADAHKASAKIKSELPGRGQQAQKEAEAYGQQAGAKFDSAVRFFSDLL